MPAEVTASMYQAAGSIGSAGITRDYQMTPTTPDFSTQFNKVTTPAKETITDKPNSIIVNSPGTYAFAYNSGSIASFITGSKIATNAGPQELPIQPVMWRRTDAGGVVGDVTFVYKGVR